MVLIWIWFRLYINSFYVSIMIGIFDFQQNPIVTWGLMNNNVEHLCVCLLTIYISSLWSVYSSICSFLLSCLLCCRYILYILTIHLLLGMYIVNILIDSVVWLFIFLMVSFRKQAVVTSITSNLSFFMVNTFLCPF